MEKHLVPNSSLPRTGQTSDWPSVDDLAALRAFHNGLETRTAVLRYLPHALKSGESARGVLARIRKLLREHAALRRRSDLDAILARAGLDRKLTARQLQRAIDALQQTVPPEPQISDAVERWFSARIARVLSEHAIRTLADLTVRIPRLRNWWRRIPGLGQRSARQIEAFFATNPGLTERARALVCIEQEDLIPWERLKIPGDLNGTRGAFRAPRRTCVLSANNDYDAVQAWLSLQESSATQRAYKKEAERLILWAIIERGKALSSLTTEEAIAYRTFLRHPTPHRRWVGPAAPRTSPQWRPFQGPLSAKSASYALSVVSAMFRWLSEQHYVLANPFAGVRVKAAGRKDASPGDRAFSENEWALVRPIADTLEDNGWKPEAANRLRFALDFSYATGLRSGEFVHATLGAISVDDDANRWIAVVGKGNKAGNVSIPPHAALALDRYLAFRGISTSPKRWKRETALLGSLPEDEVGLTGARLWATLKRFFRFAAGEIESEDVTLAEKLRRASPHWMRHTHATHALARGAALTTVRDNLRHASVSTTSAYLHTDARQRAFEMAKAFTAKTSSNVRPTRWLNEPIPSKR